MCYTFDTRYTLDTYCTPIGLATVIHQFSDLLGLELVPTADSPGPGPPDAPILCFLYVNHDVI